MILAPAAKGKLARKGGSPAVGAGVYNTNDLPAINPLDTLLQKGPAMKTPVEVRLPSDENEGWLSALLTDERSFGHPVVLLEGESHARSPIEVFLLRATSDTDEVLLEEARRAGYIVAHAS
jgi:hypothetical protein